MRDGSRESGCKERVGVRCGWRECGGRECERVGNDMTEEEREVRQAARVREFFNCGGGATL